MTTIAQGGSAVLAVVAGDSITLNSGKSDVARLTITTGDGAGSVVTASHSGRKKYGPFAAGTVTLQAVSGYCTYYVSSDGASDDLRTATVVRLDATDLSGLHTAGRPVAAGVLVASPATGVIYGQSDGAGGYEALGGGGGGGGDDVTDWGGFTAGVPSTVTVNGVTQTIGRDVDGNPITYTIALTGADDIVTTLSYDNGYSEAAGNIIKGGAITMTAAQAQFLKSEVLTALGSAANGFKARVTDLFFSTLPANATPIYHEGVFEWQNTRFRAVSGCEFDVWHNSTHVNSSAESAALATVVLPGWLCGRGNIWRNRVVHTAAGGTNSTLTTSVKVNGTSRVSAATGSGTSPTNAFELDLHCVDGAAQFFLPNAAAATGGTAATSGAYVTSTIDTTAGDITITSTAQVTVADKTITHRLTRVELLQ